MTESHTIFIDKCCPHSGNPSIGSKLTISYTPNNSLLEVASLKKYINSYRGGRGEVRSMEGMIQNIAKDCAEVLLVEVEVFADLILDPYQLMKLTCNHKYNG